MRHLVWFLALTFLLSSCSSSSVEPITDGFRCRIEAEYEDMMIVADLDRTDPSQTTLTFVQPSEISGASMILTDDRFQMQFMGITFEVPQEYTQECMLLRSLIERLDAVSEKDGDDEAFLFDDTSGVPLSLDLEDQNIHIVFSNWEFPA